MNKFGLSLNQIVKIDKIQADYYAGKYRLDYTADVPDNFDYDLAEDNLVFQLKKDVLDAFGLSNKKKADKIWDIAWDLRDDDTNQDVIRIMYKLLHLL